VASRGIENLDLQPHSAGCRFDVSYRGLGSLNVGRIDEHGNTSHCAAQFSVVSLLKAAGCKQVSGTEFLSRHGQPLGLTHTIFCLCQSLGAIGVKAQRTRSFLRCPVEPGPGFLSERLIEG